MLCLLFACAPLFGHAATAGLVLSFEADTHIRLAALTANERAAPERTTAGLAWRLEAFDTSGSGLWSRSFPAPRQFHGKAQTTLSFAISVPRVPAGTRLTMVDNVGDVRWQGTIDTQALQRAADAGADVALSSQQGYAATAILESNIPAPALVAQMALKAPDSDSKEGINRRSDGSRIRRSADSSSVAKSPAETTGFGELFNVGGRVATNNIDVRVFDADTDAFVVSTRADWTNSRFAFQLPRGRYVFEVDDNRLYIDSDFYYRKPHRTAPILIDRDTEVDEIPVETERGTFAFTARYPCDLFGTPPATNVAYTMQPEILTDDGTHIVRFELWRGVTVSPPDMSAPNGYCPVDYQVGLSPGRYTVTMAVPGWAINGVRFIC